MNEFSILVQKFGGSSVADPCKIKSVARFIKNNLEQNKRICVVVSAMGHTTDNLLALSKEITDKPVKRELDMLLSCGERTSMALLSLALNDLGVKSISLTGSQSGIITDSNHSAATITAVKPIRVLESFENYQVVIIAGFQGVSEQKEITTLKRGGSDTTAVAMAAGLKAYACEIYTDVDGVMSANPNIAAKAQLIPTLSFEQMSSMALFGAKVLAHDAAVLAQQMGITIRVAKTNGEKLGTIVQGLTFNPEQRRQILALTNVNDLTKVKISFESLMSKNFSASLFGLKLVDQDHVQGYASKEILPEIVNSNLVDPQGFALLCLHHAKKNTSELLSDIHLVLKKSDVKIEDFVISCNEILIFVKDSYAKKALEILHDTFIILE